MRALIAAPHGEVNLGGVVDTAFVTYDTDMLLLLLFAIFVQVLVPLAEPDGKTMTMTMITRSVNSAYIKR